MRLRLASFAALTASLFGSSAFASDELPTIEDFARQPAITGLSMSLEGDILVGLIADPSKDGKEMAAAYWELPDNIDTTKPLLPSNITPSGKRTNFYATTALKNKKSIWFTTQAYTGALMGCGEGKTTGSTKKYLQKAYMGNERIRKIDDLPDGSSEVGASKMMLRCFELTGETSLQSLLPLEKEDVIISRVSDKEGTKIFRHNLRTGKEKFLYKGSNTQSYQISDRDGMPISSNKLEFADGDWTQFISLKDASGEFTREDPLTTKIKDRYTMDVYGIQNGTGKYFIATDKFSDKVAVYLYDPNTDSFSSQPVFAHPEFSALGMITSQREQDFGEVLGFSYGGPVLTRYWIDPEMKSIQAGLDQAFKGHNVSLIDYTADRNRVLFSVSSASLPTEYYLLVNKSKVAVIGSSRPWLKDKNLATIEFDYVTARDGMKVPVFVAYPPGFVKGRDKARGAIIHPHGGPWSRDSAGPDNSGWIQYFATRGFVVLMPQYRGSQGFGRKLWLAGDGEWGQKMQDDKDDAAAWLVRTGVVDADKIAMHGYSYGGFASIAAAVRPNSPYQCSIAGAGVSRLDIIQNTWGSNRIQRVFQANTVDGMDPIDHTDKVNIPVLLYHGDYDVRVPLFHSTDFYNKIKSKSPESKMVVLKQMGHQSNKWLPEHKDTVLEEMERFLSTTCNMPMKSS